MLINKCQTVNIFIANPHTHYTMEYAEISLKYMLKAKLWHDTHMIWVYSMGLYVLMIICSSQISPSYSAGAD